MLTLIPSEISCRAAGIPAGMPGTLIIRFGRPTRCHRLRASFRIAASSSPANIVTSSET